MSTPLRPRLAQVPLKTYLIADWLAKLGHGRKFGSSYTRFKNAANATKLSFYFQTRTDQLMFEYLTGQKDEPK